MGDRFINTISVPLDRHERYEYTASTKIIPGELLELNGHNVTPHSKANGVILRPLFCMESSWAYPHTNELAIDQAYSKGDTAYCIVAERRQLVYAFIKGGELLQKGETLLVSGGDGSLQAARDDITAGEIVSTVVATAWEDVLTGDERERRWVKILW